MTGNREPRGPVTLNDLASWMEQLHNDMIDLARTIRENAAPDEALYCPPDLPHCPGGIRLMRSTVKSEKKTPEQMRDSFFHQLPQDRWYQKEVNGNTFHTKNHDVWRRAALTEAEAARRGLLGAQDEPEPPMPPADSDMELRESIREAVKAAGLTRFQVETAVGIAGAIAFVRGRSLADLIEEARKVPVS